MQWLQKNKVLIACCVLVAGVSMSITGLYETQNNLDECLKNTALYEFKLTELKSKLSYLTFIESVAIEFNISPLVIHTIYEKSKFHIENDQETNWRYIQTPEHLTWLFASLVSIESNGNRWATGDSNNAISYTQIWLSTAQDYKPDITKEELFNIDTHFDIAIQHFIKLLRRFDGNPTKALIAWNRGQNKVESLLAMQETPENGYVAKVYQTAIGNNTIDKLLLK